MDYAAVDVTQHWCWNSFDAAAVKETLDGYLKLRGNVAHRSRPISKGPPQNHPVKKDELEKAVRFLKRLVDATEAAFG